MSMEHVYTGWRVTREGGHGVNFSDQMRALDFWSSAPGYAEMVMTLRTIPCPLTMPGGRSFCGHCENGTPRREAVAA